MVDKLLKIAIKYLGFSEKDGKDDIIIKKYNDIRPKGGYKMTMTDPWCAAYVSVVFHEAGLSNLVPPNCSCEGLISNMKKLGTWQEDGTITPKRGDIIFYDWDSKVQPNNGWSEHVGIVEKVDKGIITVIEGNYSDMVKRRTIKVGHYHIRGYGVIKYTEDKKVDLLAVAIDVIKGKWGNGDVRKVRLTQAGLDPTEVQKLVNQILKGGK